MSVYTVHEAPWAAGARPNTERIVFVRDGFSFWAFFFAPLWMLWHRMWLVLAFYFAVAAVFEAPLVVFGTSQLAVSLVGLFIALLVGLEASSLRRFTLRRRGWTDVGVVSGDDVEDAERRFFGAWQHEKANHQSGSPPRPLASAGAAAATTPRAPQAPGIIGLFPEPGAQR